MHLFPSLVFTSVVAAHSLGHGGHARLHQHHQRQTAAQVVTTGGNGDGQVHSRLEISDLAANRPDQFSLLIQAMTQWEAQPPANQTSYYQIAGIHGVPRATWDGVSPCESCSNADGYATHDSVLFPTWHRAYLALYEQQLLDVAYQVAAAYPAGARRDAMLTAQKSLRLPYWDWAAKTAGSADVLPAVLASPQVTIDGPNGQETIANPLYAFKIPVDSAMVYSPFTNWQSTLRYPSSNDANAASADQSAVNAFNNIQGSMQESVYQLLTTCKDYAHFSNDHADSSATACTTNLEAIHNTIHTTAGGPGGNNLSGGHMTYLSLAALDPMFFIHHANVDRIFALWQTLNPSSYGGSQVAPHTTWTIEAGSTQNADSPLEPFRKDATTFWTTNTVSDWAATFKYTYPEYAAGDGSKASIINYINELYGQNPTLTASSISKQVEHNSTDSDATATATAKKGLHPVSALYPTGASSIHWAANTTSTGRYPVGTGSSPSSGNGGQYEYNCNIHTPRYSLNDSYSIYVFDGQPSTDDSSKYLGDDNCVGTIGVLAGGSMAAEIIISGSVPLTRHLQGKVMGGQLASMGKSDVNAYLKQNLSWKIIRQGEEVHPDNVPGFKAAVYSAYSSPAGKGSLPQWSQQQPQIEGTQGKAGGINSQEEADKAWPQPPVSPSGSCPGPKPTSAPVYSPTATSAPAPPAYTPAPYPTNSAPVESSPTGGTAAPSGYGSMPSSSPITPYTGAGAHHSGSSLAGAALCALAGMLLL